MSSSTPRRIHYRQVAPGGTFYFGGTALPFTPNTGNDFAGLLLGSVTKATFTSANGLWLPRWYSNAIYAQDDWTVNERLTINAGLRWSIESPFETKYGQQSQFSPTATDPLTGLPGRDSSSERAAWADITTRTSSRASAWRTRSTTTWFSAPGSGSPASICSPPTYNQNFEEYTSNVSVQQAPRQSRPALFS